MKNPVGCVPLQYEAFKKRDPEAYPQERILTELASAGYVGIAIGPYGDETPADAVARLAKYDLRPAPSYLGGGEPWKPANRPALVEKAKRFAAFASAVDVHECFVDADGWGYHTKSGKTRPEISGRVTAEDGLTDDEYKHLADSLNAAGAAMLAEGGVRICLHNHVGTVIETAEEFERILALTDPTLLFAGPDTGHLTWGGADAAAFIERHAARVVSVHLKDVYEDVRLRGVAEGWNYREYTDHGLFAECGEGIVDFPRVLSALESVQYNGWLLVETDVTTKKTPGESIIASREYLRTLGY